MQTFGQRAAKVRKEPKLTDAATSTKVCSNTFGYRVEQHTMTILGITVLIGVFGFSYLILALQVSSSFPPFYEEGNTEEEMKLDLPYMFVVLVMLAASALFPYLFVFFGLVSGWIGVRIRQRVQKRTSGPLPWLLNPLTIGVVSRWPMLLFDAWTIGLAGLMILVMLAG